MKTTYLDNKIILKQKRKTYIVAAVTEDGGDFGSLLLLMGGDDLIGKVGFVLGEDAITVNLENIFHNDLFSKFQFEDDFGAKKEDLDACNYFFNVGSGIEFVLDRASLDGGSVVGEHEGTAEMAGGNSGQRGQVKKATVERFGDTVFRRDVYLEYFL